MTIIKIGHHGDGVAAKVCQPQRQRGFTPEWPSYFCLITVKETMTGSSHSPIDGDKSYKPGTSGPHTYTLVPVKHLTGCRHYCNHTGKLPLCPELWIETPCIPTSLSATYGSVGFRNLLTLTLF